MRFTYGNKVAAAFFCFFLAAAAWAGEDGSSRNPALAKQVQDDVRAMMNATYTGNESEVLRFMHPAVIESLGGEKEAAEQVTEALGQLQRLAIEFETLAFPAEPEFVEGQGKERTFAIVPTRIVVAAGGQRAEVHNFQVGVREPDEERWTYVEGTRFVERYRSKLFPDFPEGVDLPEVSRKTL